VAGLKLSAEPLAIAGTVVLLALLSAVAIGVLDLPVWEALIGSLIAVLLHWVSDIAHHLGHAGCPPDRIPDERRSPWQVGVLGTSLYPPDEPALPAAIHIRGRWVGRPGACWYHCLRRLPRSYCGRGRRALVGGAVLVAG